jgi:hypothetical protein
VFGVVPGWLRIDWRRLGATAAFLVGVTWPMRSRKIEKNEVRCN